MLTLRKAKTAMCKLDIYNERFRYLSCAFQISVAIVSDICRVRSDICFFRIARNRNKQKIFIVSLISINNIKFACFRAICYLCNKEKIKNKHIAGVLLTLLKHTNILLGNILEQTHKKRDAMFYEY